MYWNELINATIAKMQADIDAGTCMRYRDDDTYIVFGNDGERHYDQDGQLIEFRSIEEVRAGRGF